MEIVNGLAPFLIYDNDPYIRRKQRWPPLLDDRRLHTVCDLSLFTSSSREQLLGKLYSQQCKGRD